MYHYVSRVRQETNLGYFIVSSEGVHSMVVCMSLDLIRTLPVSEKQLQSQLFGLTLGENANLDLSLLSAVCFSFMRSHYNLTC